MIWDEPRQYGRLLGEREGALAVLGRNQGARLVLERLQLPSEDSPARPPPSLDRPYAGERKP
jgi:hypothetical protein